MNQLARLDVPSADLAPAAWRPRALPIAALLAAAVVAAALAGALLSGDAASAAAARAAGPELARLLRAMAVLKAVMAAGAVALVAWRLRYAATPALAGAYILAAALMAAAPGVMWHLAHVIAGGVLFHAGLIVLVVLGYADRATGREMLAQAARRRRARAAPPVRAVTRQAGGST